ncbi:MAG: hypothetical protein K0M50_04545 [Prolixibacteraceae bacterium]|nr:hypothetical protein [Prolixibacteraceae bacterium]
MDFAFSTFVIVSLVIPGITFRRFYLTEPFSIKYIHRKLSDELIWAMVPSALFHVLGILFVELLTVYHVDLFLLIKIITSQLNDEELKSIQINAGKIFSYNILLWTLAGIMGYYFKKVVRKYDFDLKYSILRFPNIWHYYFSGEYEHILYYQQETNSNGKRQSNKKPQLPDFIFIDALVNIENKGDTIYMGLLYDYELGPDGSLSHVILRFTERRYVEDDDPSNSPTQYYKIPGKYVLIPYDKIKNLNFRYYNLEEIKKTSPKTD